MAGYFQPFANNSAAGLCLWTCGRISPKWSAWLVKGYGCLKMSLSMYLLCCFSCVRLFVTLWTVAHQALLSMGFSRQYWSGLPCPPPGDLPNSGVKPASLTSPALAGRFLTTSTTWEALKNVILSNCPLDVGSIYIFTISMSCFLTPAAEEIIKVWSLLIMWEGLPWWLSGKESSCQCRGCGLIPRPGRSPGEGNGYPLQYSCLENPMDRAAWQAAVHGDQSQTWLSDSTINSRGIFYPQVYIFMWSFITHLGFSVMLFISMFSVFFFFPPFLLGTFVLNNLDLQTGIMNPSIYNIQALLKWNCSPSLLEPLTPHFLSMWLMPLNL